jgi:hypothetical protein
MADMLPLKAPDLSRVASWKTSTVASSTSFAPTAG